MHSKHAFILALMAGAGALLFVLTAFLSLEFLAAAEPYLNGRDRNQTLEHSSVPRFATKSDGVVTQIVEVDGNAQVIRVVYSGNLTDGIVDFQLFAVPQTNYQNKIYVRSLEDSEKAALIVYPFDVVTGKILPAVINVTNNQETISPEQNRVAVINSTPERNITVYDISSGIALASWTLASNERFTESPTYRTYDGTGVQWLSNNCFSHDVWMSNAMENRLFCLDESN